METNYFAVLKDKKGIHWLPSRKGAKIPALRRYAEYYTTPPTDSEYNEWMQGIQEGKYDGIQVICGNVSKNLLVLDFDNPFHNSNDKNKLKEGEEIVEATVRAVLGKDVDSLKNETWVSSTIHNGFHVHFFVDKNIEIKSTQFSNFKVEIKGEKQLSKEYPSAGYTNLSSPENIRELSKEEYKRLVEKLETIKKNWKFIEPILEYWKLGARHNLTLGFSGLLRRDLHLNEKEAMDIIDFIVKLKNDEEPEDRKSTIKGTYSKPIEKVSAKDGFEDAGAEELYQKLCSMLPEATNSNEQQLETAIPENSIFFLDQYGKPFVHLQNVDHFENWPIESNIFRAFLTSWLKTAGISLSSEKIRSLQFLCQAAAYESNQKIELWNRYCRKNDEIYLDLGKPDWSILKISKNNIETLPSDVIMFRRYSAMAEMPIDLSGEKEDLENYLNLVNLKNEDHEKERENKLLYSVLLGTMMIPGFPHPIILVNGPQGSAKSSFSRSIRIIIDPSAVPLLSIPNKIENLVQTLSHNYASFFDNVDAISDDYSDVFCRASTGEGIIKRQLYSDEEDIIFRYQRCVLLNGINISTTRSDFIDRSIQFELETIDSTQRKTENEIIHELENLTSKVRGYLVKTIQKALIIYENTSKQLIGRLPRMADFAIWGEAVSRAMGYQPLEFFNVYTTRISDLSKSVISENAVAIELIDYLDKNDDFSEEKTLEITPSDLFNTLVERIKARGADPKASRFPGNAIQLSRKLNILKPNFETIGIKIENKIEKREGKTTKLIIFSKIKNNESNDINDKIEGYDKSKSYDSYDTFQKSWGDLPLNRVSLNTIPDVNDVKGDLKVLKSIDSIVTGDSIVTSDANDVKGDLKVLKSGVSAVTKKDGVTDEINKNDTFPEIGEPI